MHSIFGSCGRLRDPGCEMIRINLLKEPQKKRKRAKKKLNILPLVIVCGIALVVGGAGFTVWKLRSVIFPKPVKQETHEYAVKKESAPSTYSQQYIVEEVVKEVSDANQKLTQSGVLSLPYAELSFTEKINYEILFAKHVTELLGKAVPAGIGLRSLDMDNYQTLYAVGIGSSKELIQGMVTSFKNENVEILPPPYSFIKPNDGKSFKFAFSCKLEFGLNLTEPVIDAPFTVNDKLPQLVSSFEDLAKQSGISIPEGLKKISSEKIGGFYRHQYHWTGNGTYKNFVSLVSKVYQANAKCAFTKISLIALTGANLKMDCHIIITTQQ